MSSTLRELQATAERLMQAGRRAEAIAAWQALLRSAPALPDAWYNLGYLLRQEARPEQALQAYANALAQGVQMPEEVHLNRAVILTDDLQRADAAREELQQALRLNPRYAAAWLNLGNLEEEAGNAAAAAHCYLQLAGPDIDPARAADPAAAWEALARLLRVQPPDRPDAPLVQRVRAAAGAGQAVPPLVRANLWFALGQALDRLGAAAEAFTAFTEGNAASRPGAPRYDRAVATARVDRCIADDLACPPGAPEAAGGPVPVFVCGLFRSGSTLVERVLAAHPQVRTGGELDILPRLHARWRAQTPGASLLPDPAAAAVLARAYLQEFARRAGDPGPCSHLVDKRPDNHALVGLALRLFPGARIVHTVRDARDCGLSIFGQHLDLRQAPYAADLVDIGHHIVLQRRLMAHWRQHHASSVLDFDYDDFVRDPRAGLARLLDFLGLPWHEGCLDFHRLPGAVRTASQWQVREPLHARASGRWERYAPMLGPLLQVLDAHGLTPTAPSAADRTPP